MRSDIDRLMDIIDALENILRYGKKGKEIFLREELIQTWMIHNIQLIGECISNLPEEIRSADPELPWRQIVGMRNLIVHGYHKIDLEEIWSVVTKDAPRLLKQVNSLLESM